MAVNEVVQPPLNCYRLALAWALSFPKGNITQTQSSYENETY